MKQKLNLCTICLLLICFNVYSQNPLKQVHFKTTQTKVYAVPKDADIKSLTSANKKTPPKRQIYQM